ncbi:MAG: hypothetical protein ABL921_11430 [Pirellula sp.]
MQTGFATLFLIQLRIPAHLSLPAVGITQRLHSTLEFQCHFNFAVQAAAICLGLKM